MSEDMDELFDYYAILNDAEYIDDDVDYDDIDDYHDDELDTWENYYHNIAEEIDEHIC